MPIPQRYLATIEEEGLYHIYNRTNNRESLFKVDENCHFFLEKYLRYIQPLVHTYAWCLLSNHFHVLVRVKKEHEIRTYLAGLKTRKLTKTEREFLSGICTLNELIVCSFRRLFQSYSMSFNKYYARNGNLFYRPFKRVRLEDHSHFTRTVVYIHTNPVKHGQWLDFRTYPWSSYVNYLGKATGMIHKQAVIEAFGSEKEFHEAHENWEIPEEEKEWNR